MWRNKERLVTVRARIVALGSLAALATSGCSSSKGPTAPTAGSLTVTITAPAGATPSVAVTGPEGYHKSLSATQTLSGLATGSYTVTAATVRSTRSWLRSRFPRSPEGLPRSVPG